MLKAPRAPDPAPGLVALPGPAAKVMTAGCLVRIDSLLDGEQDKSATPRSWRPCENCYHRLQLFTGGVTVRGDLLGLSGTP